MGNNLSSIPSLPGGNPNRPPRSHPQNLKGKAPWAGRKWGTGAQVAGRAEVERCGWGGWAGATCGAYLETGAAHLAMEMG